LIGDVVAFMEQAEEVEVARSEAKPTLDVAIAGGIVLGDEGVAFGKV
jgi:hypothetical protein